MPCGCSIARLARCSANLCLRSENGPAPARSTGDWDALHHANVSTFTRGDRNNEQSSPLIYMFYVPYGPPPPESPLLPLRRHTHLLARLLFPCVSPSSCNPLITTQPQMPASVRAQPVLLMLLLVLMLPPPSRCRCRSFILPVVVAIVVIETRAESRQQPEYGNRTNLTVAIIRTGHGQHDSE